MCAIIEREYGRVAFGTDPAAYHEARPEYPAKIYEILKNRCGLAPGSRTFEVGPGTGLASTKLLELGASPLVLIEPDKRLAKFLKTRLLPAAGRLQIENASFEDVQLNSRSFDLGIAASSFHWMNERPMLRKAARLLRSGGWWAMWWHVFRDLSRPSEFQRATHQLLSPLSRRVGHGQLLPAQRAAAPHRPARPRPHRGFKGNPGGRLWRRITHHGVQQRFRYRARKSYMN